MKKFLAAATCCLMALCAVGCGASSQGGTQGGGTPDETEKGVSYIAKTEDGKPYYCIDEKPFLPIGIQIRSDIVLYRENREFSAVEELFRKAKDLGVTMVEIPVLWEACEKQKDVYDFKDLGKMMNLSKELGLKMELLTFGTNTTGWSSHAPQYVHRDSATYPRYSSPDAPDGLFLVQNDPDLLEREGLWISRMMENIHNWSVQNSYNPVVSVQIHNEADTFPRFVLSQKRIMTVDGSRRLTDIEAWRETLEAYDYLGKAVKSSPYKCITRVNVAQAYKDSWEGFVGDIFALEGIDIVGDDTYEKTVAFNKAVILDFNKEDVFGGNNFPHVSENDGSYNTTPSLVLAAVGLGGGYMIYDLATPVYGMTSLGWDDWSILDPYTLEDKAHTGLTRKVIKGLTASGSDIVLNKKENVALFNVAGNVPETQKTQALQTERALLSFTTEAGALGYAVTGENYIDLFVTADAEVEIIGAEYEKVLYEGKVDLSGAFASSGSREIESGAISLHGNTFYRLNVTSYGDKLVSNTVNNIGVS